MKMKKYVKFAIVMLSTMFVSFLFVTETQALSWESCSDSTVFLKTETSLTINNFDGALNGKAFEVYNEKALLDKRGVKSESYGKALRSFEYVHHAIDNSQVPVIPEPATYAMVLAGIGLLAFTLRHRKSNIYD